jgi:HSP20 family protein
MAAVPTPWRGLLNLLGRALHPPSGPFAIEEYDEGGTYVVRAELPGLNPAKQVSVVVADDELKIDVDRFPEHVDQARSEFWYGPCSRTVTLPWGARCETATARYDNGILEVTVEVAKRAPIGRTVPITTAGPAVVETRRRSG